MPRDVNGTQYFSVTEVAVDLGVSRQTMWRWRKDGKIPVGHRFRDRQVFFTVAELESIHEFANHVEPIGDVSRDQLRLFN